MRPFRLLILAGCLGLLVGSLPAAESTQARLVLSTEAARPGDTVMAGVELRMLPKWHTYWRNAGDSGIATKIDWQLPPGISAGQIQWPPPDKDTAADLTTYVYYDEVVLLVPLTLNSNLSSGPVAIKAGVSWLECMDTCLPGKADVQATLIVASESKPSKEAALLAAWQKKLPAPSQALAVKAFWEKPTGGDTRPMRIEWEPPTPVAQADFFPFGGDDYEMAGLTERENLSGKTVAIRKLVKKLSGKWPDRVQGLIVATASAGAPRQAYEVNLTLAAAADGVARVAAGVPVSSNSPPVPRKSLANMLLLAFLGGLILNIMPCVLPVIALKILGFVNQSKEDTRRVRQLGFIYAAGVLASFLALAGLVIAVQRAGHDANWGMQFQNPQFVVVMTVVVTLVALNLFGLFEVTLSGGAMSAASTLAYKEGGAGAFFNGVLATALATPCTAPFLGVALGFAFTQPPGIIVLMFAAVAMGLAAPYVVLSWEPRWLRFLPKPGAWMEKFKIAMGFPMLGTAIWLLWLATSHFGNDASLWLGIFLAVVAMSAWIWGEFVQRGRKNRALAMATSCLLVLGAYCYVLEGELNWRSPLAVSQSGGPSPTDPDGIAWQPWTAKAVEDARAAGHPVLVDFTAKWCWTCQVNKKTSLERSSVRQKLKAINAVAFLGDYTDKNPTITAELKKYERAGVPLVLVYPPDPSARPEVLPEVLTPDIVLAALNKAAGSKVVSQAPSTHARE